ncbi:MAG: hypothetical protein GX220_05910 [Treponema sp.]|nr:hypothetical protein [Treponema sp.]
MKNTKVNINNIIIPLTEKDYSSSLNIPKEILFSILFEMNRYFDKNFVQFIREHNLKLTQHKRNALRKYFY